MRVLYCPTDKAWILSYPQQCFRFHHATIHVNLGWVGAAILRDEQQSKEERQVDLNVCKRTEILQYKDLPLLKK